MQIKGLLNTYTQPGTGPTKANGKTRVRWSTIVLYEERYNGDIVHRFDVQNGILIIDGVNYSQQANQLVAI